MEFAWTSGENEFERLTSLQLAQIGAKIRTDLAQFAAERDDVANVGGFISQLLSPFATTGLSWVAKKVFPPK